MQAPARCFLLCALLALPLLTVAQPDLGSSTGTESHAASELGEIIVTAQKRAENLQDVPVSMTVVNAEQLTAAGVHNFQDLPSVAPSLSIAAGGNGQNTSVEIRGVGAYSFSYLTEPDVAIIIDDVPVASQSQAFSNLSDIAQIEVLRGPQTTLFGKSASAGVVSITTAAPSQTFGGKLEASYTNDHEQVYSGTVTGPIRDNLSLRLTGTIDDFRGNSRNEYDGQWTNGENTGSLRGKLRWTPGDKLTVDIVGAYTHADGSLGIVPAPVYVPPTATWLGAGSAAQAFAGFAVNGSNSTISNDAPPVLDYEIKSGSVRVSYDAGPVTLLSITGYSDYSTFNIDDFDFTDLNILGFFTHDALNGGLSQEFNETTKQVSQEFRAVSGPGSFRYVAGLWYADKKDDYTTVRGPDFPGVGSHLYANYFYDDSSAQYAVYGQTEWDVAPQFTVVTGLRGSEERIGYDIDNVFKDFLSSGSHLHGVVTGKFALEYHPLQNINLFASYTRGYKGETYDLTSSFTAALAAHGPVKPETSDSVEIGIKTQFFDRRLTANLTAFNTKYTDFQAQTILPIVGTGFILANVGSVRTRGLELDSRYQPNSVFNVGLSGTYLNARILSYPDGQCYYTQTTAEGCITTAAGSFYNLGGKPLANAPTFKGNLDASFTEHLPGIPFDAVYTGTWKYQSSVNFSLSQDPLTYEGGYGIVNLSAGLQHTHGANYRITLFADNVFNRHYYDGLTDYTPFSTANTFGFVPRDFRAYYGIRAGYSF
jgi:iron complex outermembrane receptor protein